MTESESDCLLTQWKGLDGIVVPSKTRGGDTTKMEGDRGVWVTSPAETLRKFLSLRCWKRTVEWARELQLRWITARVFIKQITSRAMSELIFHWTQNCGRPHNKQMLCCQTCHNHDFISSTENNWRYLVERLLPLNPIDLLYMDTKPQRRFSKYLLSFSVEERVRHMRVNEQWQNISVFGWTVSLKWYMQNHINPSFKYYKWLPHPGWWFKEIQNPK